MSLPIVNSSKSAYPDGAGAMVSAEGYEDSRWFVMRAYKNENKAEEVLGGENGLPYFIPKQYAVRVYHGKKTRRLVPVIPGLVFVHASQSAISDFKKRHNFLQFVMRTRNAADKNYLVVPDRQMADFMKVAGQYEENVTYYNPDELHLEKGTRVRISAGRSTAWKVSSSKCKGASPAVGGADSQYVGRRGLSRTRFGGSYKRLILDSRTQFLKVNL